MQQRQQDKPTEQRKAKRSRRWPRVVGGVVLLFLLILLILPVILSSGAFTHLIQKRISRSTGGQADIGNLSIGWLRGIRVADFSFRAENGWTEVDIARITTQPSLSRLLSGTLALERTVLSQPRVAIDLRERPASSEDGKPVDMGQLARIGEVIVRDGAVQLTDTNGQTVQVSNLDSQVHVRQPGRPSEFSLDAVVAQAGPPARVQASAQMTPDKKTGWSLKGTTGALTVEVNDLNLDAVAPFLRLAGIQVETSGRLSANLVSQIADGHIDNVDATIAGQNLVVAGKALQGDRLQTSQLNVRANLTQKDNVINVSQLNVRTDWATVAATGRLPMTVRSLSGFLQADQAHDLQGTFDIDLASVLAQMPNTTGVREGMEVTEGRATGTVSTTSQAGRTALVAQAQVAGLAGLVDGRKLSLSQPIQATARVAAGQQGPELQQLNVSAPFATVNASGSFQQIRYDGKVDLSGLQSELGPFINLGRHKLAGQVASTGKISISEEATDLAGSLSARQLVLTTPDGNSVSEPAADIDFALSMNGPKQLLAIGALTAKTGFGTLAVKDATIPMGQASQVPFDLAISARDVGLARLKPYLVVFAGLPRDIVLDGTAQSQLTVARHKGTYHVATDATRIQSFVLASPPDELFKQEHVTASFDVFVDPNAKTINVDRLLIASPQIKIKKGELRRTSRDNTATLNGSLEAEWDWSAVAKAASILVPGGLDLGGYRQVAINFASTYPVDEPNGLLTHLDSRAALGFDSAEYMGLSFGPTQIDVRIEDGLMQIEPFSTTVNQGRFRFAAGANLARTPALLKTPEALQMAEGVRITVEMTRQLLRFLNPIFADVASISGIVSFDCQSLAIPLSQGRSDALELVDTISMQEVRLEASLLNKILSVIRESARDQVIRISPTKISLRNGVLQYDDMEVIVGDNPINFSGAIGLDGKLDMRVVLPYTYEGRTARVGEPDARRDRRITLPLTGTLDSPQLDLQKLLESQLQEQIFRGFKRLFD